LLLLLRITLVPVLIAGVTLATRRWGPRVGGFVNALPAVAGPTLCFYAVQQGNAFAADATRGTLLGLIALSAFCVTYARASTRLRWAPCLLLGWLAFAVVTMVTYRINVGPIMALAAALSALLGGRLLLPAARPVAPAGMPPRWDLPMRMISAAVLVFALTSLAERLGSSVSGALTPFPVATAIIGAFTHSQRGSAGVVAFLRGYVPGLCTFAVFCCVLSMTLRWWPLVPSVTLALVIQLTLQGVLIARPDQVGPPKGGPYVQSR
jgi:hypothetical protein